MRWRALVILLTVLSGGSRMWGQTEKSFVISGDVRLEDGTAPPDAVQINRVCGGHTTATASTDTMGHFTFSVEAGRPDGNSRRRCAYRPGIGSQQAAECRLHAILQSDYHCAAGLRGTGGSGGISQ
jgi:hypothetical protein